MWMRRASRGRRYFPLSLREVEGIEGMLESVWLGAAFCEEVRLADDGSSGGVRG